MLFRPRAFTFWFIVVVVEVCLTNALLRQASTTTSASQQQQPAFGSLRRPISNESTVHSNHVISSADTNLTEEEEASADSNEDGAEPLIVKTNKLRFILLGDWGKGGNTGMYMSSYNMSLHGGDSLEDTSDVSGSAAATASPAAAAAAAAAAVANSSASIQGGNNQALYQPQVAKAMGTYAASADPAPSFVVSLGDNFYTKGVSSATDSLWQYLWEDVYLGYEGLNVPWYPVFGNHDYGSANAVQAQIDRYNLHMNNDIWQFPSTNYSKIFEIPGKEGASVGIVFIDSTTLAPSFNGCCNSKGGISEDEQARRIKNQLYHINRMLEELVAAQVTWLLVAGHYPVFSPGSSGDPSEMTSYLLPLLQKYNVHAYLCGHDHLTSHSQYSDTVTEFFMTGAGSMTDTLYYKSKANLVWGGPGYAAFGYMEATSKYLEFGVIDTNNDVKYQYSLTNPFALKIPPTSMPTSSPTTVKDDDNDVSSQLIALINRNGALVLISGSMAVVGILIAGVCLYGSVAKSSKSKQEDKSLLLKAGTAKVVMSSSKKTLPTEDIDEDEDDEEHGNAANLAARRLAARNERRMRRSMKLAATYEVLRDDQDHDHDQRLSHGSDFEPKPLALTSPSMFQHMPSSSQAPPSSPIDLAKAHKRSQSLQSKGDILSMAIGEVSSKGAAAANRSSKGSHRRVQTMAI